MDGRNTGSSVNGSQEPKHGGNEAKEKMKKTLLLKQQIEENRMKMLQREKDKSNREKNLEQLFTQLDRSASGAALNISTAPDVDDMKDSKIAALESSVSTLKSEKRKLEMKLVSLETIQEAKECLEIEISQLNISHENLLSENSSLQARLEKFHELEDENYELKSQLDRLSYENGDLKQDLELRDKSIKKLESKLDKVNQELQQEREAVKSSDPQINVEDLERQIKDLTNEKQQLHLECQELKAKLNTAATVVQPEVKVATLGASKKAKTKRGKGNGEDDLAQQLALLTSQKNVFEEENRALKGNLEQLEKQVEQGEADQRTLQQRIQLLTDELSISSSAAGSSSNDLANLQTLLQEKEAECAALAAQLSDAQTQQEGWEAELFNQRAKVRDAEYVINSKEEALRALQLLVDNQTSSSAQMDQLEEMVADLEARLSSKEEELRQAAADVAQKSDAIAGFEIKLAQLDEEKQKLEKECLELQTKLTEAPSSPVAAVKVSSLGSPSKKSRSKRGKKNSPAASEPVESTPETTSEHLELNSRITELENENATLRAHEIQLAELRDQVSSLEEQLSTSLADKRILQQRVDLLLSELDSSGSQGNDVASLQTLLASKDQECSAIVTERDEIRQQLNDAEAELFKLRAQQRDTQYLLSSKEETILALEAQSSEMDVLRAHISDLEAKMHSEDKSSLITRLQESLRQVRDELSSAERELSDRTEAIQKLEKSCATLNKDCTEKSAEIQRLKDDLQEAEVVLAEQDAKFKTVQDELNRMKMQADADADRAALESELNHSQMEREMLRNDVQTYCTQLDECKAVGDRLEAQLESLKARETELLALNEATIAGKTAVDEKLTQLSDKFKKLAANYKQKLTLIQQLEGKIEKMKRASSEGQESGSEDAQFLRIRLAEAEDEIQLMRDQLDKLKEAADKVPHIQLALNRAESDLQSANNEKEDLVDRINRLEEAAGQVNEMRATLTQLEAEHSVSQDQLQSTEEELKELKNQLERVANDLAVAQEENGKLSGQLTQAEHHLEQLKDDKRRLVMQADEDMEGAQLEAQQAVEESRKLLEQLDRASDKISQLQVQLEEEVIRNNENVSIINQLRTELESRSVSNGLEDLLKDVSSARDNLQQEVDNLRSRLESSVQEAGSLHQQLAGLWQEKEDLVGRNAQLETELNDAQDSLSSIQREAAILTEDLTRIQEQRQQDADRIASLEKQLNEMSQNNGLEQEIQDLRDQLAAAQWDLDTKAGELSNAQQQMSKIGQLEEELVQLRQTGSSQSGLNDEIQQLRDKLEAAQLDLDTKTHELSSIHHHRQQDVERISQLELELSQLRQSAPLSSESNQEVHELREQLESVQWDLDTKINELSSIHRQHQQDVEKIAHLEQELGQLRQSGPLPSGQDQSIQELQDQLESLQWDLDTKTSELSNINRQHQQDVDRIAYLEQELGQLRQPGSIPSGWDQEMQVLRDQLESVQWDLDTKNSELSNIHRQHQQDVEKITHLEQELGQLRQSGPLPYGQDQAIQELRDHLESIQWDLDTKINELSTINHYRQQDAERIAHLEQELSQLRQSGPLPSGMDQEIQDLRNQLGSAQWDLDTKANELSSMQYQYQQSVERIAHLEQKLNQLRESAQIPSGQNQEIQELRDQLASTQRDRQQEAGRNTQLEQELYHLRQSGPQEPQQFGMEQETQYLRDQLSSAQWSLENKLGELAGLQQQHDYDAGRIAQLEEQLRQQQQSAGADGQHPAEDLKSRITELEQQLADANNHYASLYDTYGSKLFEMTTLENQLADASHQRSAAEERINELSAELVGLQTSLNEKSSMEAETQSRISDLEATNIQLRDRIQELDQESAQLRSSIDSIHEQKKLADMEIQALKTASDELRHKLEIAEQGAADIQEIGLLRMNLADLSAERDDIQFQLEDYQAQCAALETKLTEAEEVRSILETTVSYLESKVGTLQAEASSHATEVSAWEEERNSLVARLDSAEALRKESESLRLTLEEAERMQKEADSTLNEARRSGREAIARADEIQQQLSDSLRCLLEEQQKCRSISDERDELAAQLVEMEQLRTERSELLEQLSVLRQDLDRLQSSTLTEAEEADKMRTSLEESKQQAEELSQLRLRLFEAITEKEEVESSIQVLEEEVSALRIQLESGGSASDLQAQLAQSMSEKEALTVSIRQLEEQLGSIQMEANAGRSAINDEVSQLRVKLMNTLTEKEDLESSVQALEEELASVRMQLEYGQNTIADESARLREELAQLSADNEKLNTTVEVLEDELATLRLESSTGHNSAVELTARCADLDMERNLLMEKCIELRDGQAALEAKCADLETRRIEAEASSTTVAAAAPSSAQLSELSQLRVALMDLTAERDELEEKVADLEEKLTELANLQVTNSELSMELDESLAKIQMVEEQRAAEAAELKRQLAEVIAKLSQQEERIERVSVERDELQQAVLRIDSSRTEESFQTSSSGETNLSEEALKKRIAELEQELYDTKIKAAKSLRQVKLLRAEAAKQKTAAAATAGGTEDYFNSAVEEELRKQVTDAEKTTAEKIKEIASLLTRIDMLEGANERFMQAKERQDNEMAMLQQRNRELLSQISSLEWDSGETKPVPVSSEPPKEQQSVPSSPEADEERFAALESTISQLTEDNEHFQDVLDELKTERKEAETELKARIKELEADLAEKTRLLDDISQQMDNKDRLLSDAYDSVNQLRKQVMQLSESSGSSALVEELRRENENLVDMIRQLSTTGTLDAATVQRLKDEIEASGSVINPEMDPHLLNQSGSSEAGEIDWHGAFNDLQIEVEYLRSQNAALLNRLQEAGLAWDEEGGEAYEDGDRTEMLRLQLDNAIRNVHEREMRCQELTWEITKLLEERDTLQLRLSNSLRQNHEMQQELKDFTNTANSSESDIAAKLRELKQLNYSLDVQLRREQEERQTIERQLMALYGSRGGSTSPYANGARRSRSRQNNADDSIGGQPSNTGETDLNSSQESLGTGQVLSDWLKGKGSVQHV